MLADNNEWGTVAEWLARCFLDQQVAGLNLGGSTFWRIVTLSKLFTRINAGQLNLSSFGINKLVLTFLSFVQLLVTLAVKSVEFCKFWWWPVGYYELDVGVSNRFTRQLSSDLPVVTWLRMAWGSNKIRVQSDSFFTSVTPKQTRLGVSTKFNDANVDYAVVLNVPVSLFVAMVDGLCVKNIKMLCSLRGKKN